jgi:hypothetical protein
MGLLVKTKDRSGSSCQENTFGMIQVLTACKSAMLYTVWIDVLNLFPSVFIYPH